LFFANQQPILWVDVSL